MPATGVAPARALGCPSGAVGVVETIAAGAASAVAELGALGRSTVAVAPGRGARTTYAAVPIPAMTMKAGGSAVQSPGALA